MKKILTLVFLGCALCASAQLTVLEDGRTVLGRPSGTAATLSPATLSIFDVPPSDGTVSAVSASGSLSFGSGMGSMIYGSGVNGYVREYPGKQSACQMDLQLASVQNYR